MSSLNDNVNDGIAALALMAPAAPVFTVGEVDGGGRLIARGSAEAGALVSLTWPNGDGDEVRADATGHWQLESVAVQNEGAVVVSVANEVGSSVEVVVNYFDTQAPQAPGIRLSGADADGHIHASGTAEAGAEVIINWPDGRTVSRTIANEYGNWSMVSPTVQVEGVVSASVKDAAGNYSPETMVVYVDTTAPRAPIVETVADSDANGRIDVSGMAEIDSVVRITWPNGQDSYITTDGAGHWALESPAVQTSGTIKVVAVDQAGNYSDAATFAYVDITAPKAPILSVNDGDADNKLNASGTAEVGSTVTITWPNGDISTIVTDGAGGWSLESKNMQGSGQVRATATDEVGNMSNPAVVNYLDKTVPVAPGLSLHSDSGFSQNDRVTNAAQVDVSGLEADGGWQYMVDNGAWLTGRGSSFALSEGAHAYTVRQTDAAANLSAVSTPVVYTLDTTVAAPKFELDTDNFWNAPFGTRRDETFAVSDVEAGGRWEYQVDGGAWLAGVGGGFEPSFYQHTYAVRQVDAAGNLSAASAATSYYYHDNRDAAAVPATVLHLQASDVAPPVSEEVLLPDGSGSGMFFNGVTIGYNGTTRIDTVVLDGTGAVWDLNNSGSQVWSFERINLGADGGNTLTVGMSDIVKMSGTDLFNGNNGWRGLAVSESRHQVILDGVAGDIVNLSQRNGVWTDTHTTATNGGHTFAVWNAGGVDGAQLLIDQLLTVHQNI